MMGFGFLGMLLFWGLFLALIVGGLVFLLRQTTGTQTSNGAEDRTALRILDERLARGEIDREEYEAIRATLER
ncbi:MAG TPA: SHOCT domain-containing protein [Thermoflexia bacterium]|nr:SHOCT domain-containing protein [Thermoflexia bacterium]